MKRNAKLISALVVSVLLAGCAANERIVHVRPHCEPVPVPVLPHIDRGELWDSLGDARYREIERYINGVWAWGDEQAAILAAVCG